MVLLTAHHWPWVNGVNCFGQKEKASFSYTECIQQHNRFRADVKAFATRKSAKKLRKPKRDVVLQTTNDSPLDDNTTDGGGGLPPNIENFEDDSLANDKERVNSVSIPSRSSVLQACTLTSGFIAALGLLIRQVSHVASSAGLPILDCGAQVSFDFEIWHLELIAGLVVLISSSRYLFLKTWPDFAESSEVANKQVLTSLDTFDYVIVAFLPGISEVRTGNKMKKKIKVKRRCFWLKLFCTLRYQYDLFGCLGLWVGLLFLQELLFRGALLPLFGLDWKSAFVTAAIFGILHLGNGRNYSFAAWATFVGLAYGYSTIISSSMVVAMASHALNNLVGAIMWRYTSKSSYLE